MTVRNRDKYYIRSVDNALQLLETLCESDRDAHLSELSARSGLSKSTIFRLLITFERRGYVEQDQPSHGYRLGLSAFEMGQKCLSRMALLTKARPVMAQLTRQTREATYLAVRRGEEALLLDLAETPQQVKIIPLTGQRLPLANTAVGKIFSVFDRRGTKAILPAAEQAGIRQNGYALLADDIAPGVVSLAAPLFDYQQRLPGVLLTVVPDFRVATRQRRTELASQLREACDLLSSRLGHQPLAQCAEGA